MMTAFEIFGYTVVAIYTILFIVKGVKEREDPLKFTDEECRSILKAGSSFERAYDEMRRKKEKEK